MFFCWFSHRLHSFVSQHASVDCNNNVSFSSTHHTLFYYAYTIFFGFCTRTIWMLPSSVFIRVLLFWKSPPALNVAILRSKDTDLACFSCLRYNTIFISQENNGLGNVQDPCSNLVTESTSLVKAPSRLIFMIKKLKKIKLCVIFTKICLTFYFLKNTQCDHLRQKKNNSHVSGKKILVDVMFLLQQQLTTILSLATAPRVASQHYRLYVRSLYITGCFRIFQSITQTQSFF